jgi:hypothetical protein
MTGDDADLAARWADHLDRLLQDLPTARQRAAALREHLGANYSWAHAAENLVERLRQDDLRSSQREVASTRLPRTRAPADVPGTEPEPNRIGTEAIKPTDGPVLVRSQRAELAMDGRSGGRDDEPIPGDPHVSAEDARRPLTIEELTAKTRRAREAVESALRQERESAGAVATEAQQQPELAVDQETDRSIGYRDDGPTLTR